MPKHRPTLWDLPRALIACVVVAIGTAMRSVAVFRAVVVTNPLITVAASLVCVLPFSPLFLRKQRLKDSRVSKGGSMKKSRLQAGQSLN